VSVAAYSEPWLFPLTPFNLADGVQAPTLLLAGRMDIIISIDATQKLFSSLKTDVKEMELYDSGHRLPRENINRSVGWLNEYLKKK
jgi:predicted esterase